MSDEDLRVDMRPDSVRNKIKIENLENIIRRHKLGVKGEYYFSNKQVAIERLEEVLRGLGKEIVGYFQGDFRENEIEAIDLMCNNINKLLEKLK